MFSSGPLVCGQVHGAAIFVWHIRKDQLHRHFELDKTIQHQVHTVPSRCTILNQVLHFLRTNQTLLIFKLASFQGGMKHRQGSLLHTSLAMFTHFVCVCVC
eukprot:scpid93845/ scgid31412/ 